MIKQRRRGYDDGNAEPEGKHDPRHIFPIVILFFFHSLR